jgi:hypothetical protein
MNPCTVVVAHEHALRFGREPAVRPQLVLEIEAPRADSGAARAHLDLVAGA